jgi:hypothetical protein
MSKERVEELVNQMAGGPPQVEPQTLGGEGDTLQAWQGPFAEYEFVNVPGVGELSVDAFHVMWIELRYEFSRKEQEWLWRSYKKQRPATDAELKRARLDTNVLLPWSDPDYKKPLGKPLEHTALAAGQIPPGFTVEQPAQWSPQNRPLDSDFAPKETA